MNLGSPDSTKVSDVRKYLKEFLMDERVLDTPFPIRWFVVNCLILPKRPKESAEAYQTVWTEEGSPLLLYTQTQAKQLQSQLADELGSSVIVDFAMRYGSPSMAEKLQSLQTAGARKLLVLPLYPQYSAATTGSTFDVLAKDFTQRRWLPDLRFISHYHDHPQYIKIIAKRIQAFWDQHGKPQKLVFSYHGVPLRYLHNGDPYHCECHKTTRLIAEYLGLQISDYMTCFQSRFGREEWLKPYTDETLKSLPEQGIKSVQIICPGFSSDCLETIEEIGEENREYFMESGGEQYAYIPALNEEEDHIDFLAELVKENIQGWSLPDPDSGKQAEKHYLAYKEKSIS